MQHLRRSRCLCLSMDRLIATSGVYARESVGTQLERAHTVTLENANDGSGTASGEVDVGGFRGDRESKDKGRRMIRPP